MKKISNFSCYFTPVGSGILVHAPHWLFSRITMLAREIITDPAVSQ
jgi:hypothetical protein